MTQRLLYYSNMNSVDVRNLYQKEMIHHQSTGKKLFYCTYKYKCIEVSLMYYDKNTSSNRNLMRIT